MPRETGEAMPPRSVGAEPGRERFQLALGLERLGLISLRFPRAIAVVVIALMILAGFGVARIKVDDSLSQLFRSNTPEFRTYEEVTQRFPSSEFDVLLVVQGEDLLARESVEKLRDLAVDLQLIDGVRGALSMFAARQPPEDGKIPPPLFPNELPEGEAYQKLIQRVMTNEIIRGKLLSADGQLTLIVAPLDPKIVADNRLLRKTVAEIRKTIKEDLAGANLKTELSGVPVMQLEIRNAVERDRVLYNTIGFAAGCLIAIYFFRRASFMIVAAGPPLVAILLALGALGWLDFRLNMFLNVMTPLIMVISFSDSMQLTFATRDRLLAGQSKRDALRSALLVVGPACVLTHATAALSFLALLNSNSYLIRAFGEAGVISSLVAFVAVLVLMPLLGVMLLHRDAAVMAGIEEHDFAINALRRFCAWIAGRMVKRPGLYSLIDLAVVGALAFTYLHLEPRYRLADQVPDREQAVAANRSLDAKLAGANPIDILIQFPKGETLYSPRTLAVLAKVHTILERQAGVGNVWSLETLRRWLAEKMGRQDVATLRQYVNMLPSSLTRRFISANQESQIVTGRLPDIDASELLPTIRSLEKSLNEVRASYPGYKISVTGLAVIAARNSANMIQKLSLGLTFEFIFVAGFIGLAFRSFSVMLMSFLPGVFPIVASGALLSLLGLGLQFASIVALTVSFGLGLSATIHFLNRLRLEDEPTADPAIGVQRATVLVGPALILTSVVLACGLAVTIFSDLPTLRLFGWLSAFAMIAALTADLLILRPTAMFLLRLFRRPTSGLGRTRGEPQSGEPGPSGRREAQARGRVELQRGRNR